MSTPTASSSSSSTSFVDAREDDALLDVERANGARAGQHHRRSPGRRRRRGVARAVDALTHPIVTAVLVTLGVCGMIYRQEALARQGDDAAFVRVAHEIWLGSEVPGVKRMIFERNKKVLEERGWEMKLWTEGDITERNFPWTLATLERGRAYHQLTGSNVYSMLVDLMKYEVLYRHGGLYLDTNVELFKDITPLFRRTVREKKEVFMVADPGDSRFYSAGIFGAPTPGAQVFEKMLNSTNYLRGIDFGKRCIANAITGPVWLSHVIRANTLDETILRFDRDVAYPLGCGENEFDSCVKEVTREDAKNDSRVQWMMENDVLSGKELGGTKSSLTKYVAQTWRRVTSGADDWNPLMLSHALVQEADGSFWNTTLPCQTIARQYPRSYAIDHFSFHGASWQDGCTPKERQAMVVEWLEKNIPATESLVHQWALSFVRMLSPAPSSSLVTRVRLHESGGTYKKARLLIASSPLRAGASLLGEALATSSNHPLHSALWERDGSVRSDSYFANFINLGDWWSVSEVPKDDDASWRGKLRKFLLDIGVKEATVDASFTYPGEFLNEVLSRSWEAGVDKVYVSLIGVHVDSTPRELDRMEKLFKSILESVAETPLVICLGRDNKLDMYVSTVRAMNGDAPLQQIRESAEPFDAENVTVRERRDNVAGVGRVRFDEARYQEFVRNDKRWTRTTSRAVEAHDNHCVNLKYEDDLSTPTALAETMRWLHDRYALDLNHEATKLLKLERVNAAVTAADIVNVRALNAHAKYFLRTAVEPATDEIENAYDDEST